MREREELLYYDTSVQSYGQPTNLTLDKYCNLIIVKNAGTSVLNFDDDPLQPGESKVIGGNRREILTGRHNISFTTGVGQVNLCIYTQKYYVPSPPGSCDYV